MQKIVCTTRYESIFFSLICLINSGYTLVNQSSCTNNYFLSPTSFFSCSFPPFHISFIHLISLLCSFSISPRSVLFLFLISRLIAHSTPFFLSFHSIPVSSLLVPTSKSRLHFFSLAHSFSSGTPEFPLSYFLLYQDSLILSLLSRLSSSLSLLVLFIHLPFALNLSTFSLAPVSLRIALKCHMIYIDKSQLRIV
jgi:hypothetical protein